jgi:hypothetical protein
VARKLRIEEPGAIYNVGSRGNNKETMFHDEVDRMEFLRLLAKVAVRYDWQGWAYCLMGNHFHLLVQIRPAGFLAGCNCSTAAMRFARTSATAVGATSFATGSIPGR